MRNDPNDDRNEETYRNIIKDRNLELDRTYAERSEYYNEMKRLQALVSVMRPALEACLNYIENTENELGITLSCGEKARAALATGGKVNG